MAYITFVSHRDRLTEQGKIVKVNTVVCKQGVFQITCPAGAEAERGVDRVPDEQPRKVLRWG